MRRFAVGLLEAASMARIEHRDALLVAYDLPAPQPLWSKRPVAHPFGVALFLRAQPSANTMAVLTLSIADARATMLDDSALEALRLSNPAARALPLLCAIARREAGVLCLPHSPHNLRIHIG